MRKSRFTEEQIIAMFQEADASLGTKESCRKHGIRVNTLYGWTALYGGLKVSEAKRLRQVEDKSRRPKKMIDDQALDIQALKAVLKTKWRARGSDERPGISSARASR